MKETDLKAAISRTCSKNDVIELARIIHRDEYLFNRLTRVYFDNEHPELAKKAAWILSCCVELHPEMIQPYLKKLVDCIALPGQHDAIKRNGLKILESVPIPFTLFGKIADQCFKCIKSGKEPVAIKAYSIGILDKISKEIPEIREELKIILQDLLPFESAGFRVRAKRVLSK